MFFGDSLEQPIIALALDIAAKTIASISSISSISSIPMHAEISFDALFNFLFTLSRRPKNQ